MHVNFVKTEDPFFLNFAEYWIHACASWLYEGIGVEVNC
jgi:hypothetical protein